MPAFSVGGRSTFDGWQGSDGRTMAGG